ncbi:hypothetical protein L1286_23740 [Pseudoalteromonas sp. SMS1]|uniref:hypothetical protein n=1 Tax=Pseudoalteromonas sp. SMS1 TaxID=2908894 RepID=UPI001F34F510|nr:hypothetical protein [Pseudoalteromonas sp. SMS1]MCF2860480.1 hypothetical protein [Pseudoalteromonas sp. SMS1]
MALFTINDRIYASHLPMPHGMHAVQFIFETQLPSQYKAQLMPLLNDRTLVTVRPETLSLNKLRAGQLTQFKGDVFIGHFERSGKNKYPAITLTVQNIILNEPVNASQKNGQFYALRLDNNTCLLVHKIGKSPSFDRIETAPCNNRQQYKTQKSNALSEPVETFPLTDFVHTETLYLETKDFK